MLTVGSLFAGIGGFDLGFERNGFKVRWQAEQDSKAQAVLSARFPTARLYDDVRTIGAANLEPIDVICGGFPCQDVSVAGKREGLGGERTGLFWEVVRIAREMQPRWMVLENVPGLLSSHGGRDFHAVLTALADCGFRRSYRILDSRYFGVAQRRRRVFIVLRARRCDDGAEAVLFGSQSSDGDSQAGSEARPVVAATLRGCSHGAGVHMPGRDGEDDENLVYQESQYGIKGYKEAGTLRAGRIPEHQMIAHTLRQNERNTSQGPGNYINALCPIGGGADDNDAQAGHLIIAERAPALVGSMYKRHDADADTLIPTLSASLGHHGHSSPRGDGNDPLVAFALRADPGGTGQGHNTTYPGGVRRPNPLGVRAPTRLPRWLDVPLW